MSVLSLNDLLEAGTHFGHQTKRWNPKMKRYILTSRNGIYIVDLNKTLEGIDKFIARVKKEVEAGGKVLFVGTKKQVKDCIAEEATRCGMPYVTERWLGGMLTNFQTIRQSVKRLEKIEQMEKDESVLSLTKKEQLVVGKKKVKLVEILSGVRYLRRLPTIVFIVDTIKEHIGVAEARRLGLPIGAIVDTNCDPDEIDYCIPGNDDALKSVQLIVRTIADAIIDSNKNAKTDDDAAEKGDGSKIAVKLTDLPDDADGEAVEEVVLDADGKPVIAGAAAARKRRIVRKKMVSSPAAA